MKTTMEYVVGNTALQIINTGKRIKVVDVEKKETRRFFIKTVLMILFISAISLFGCVWLISLQKQSTVMTEQVYTLQSQVTDLEMETKGLRKEVDNLTVDYAEILKKAKVLGMDFPKEGQILSYENLPSNMVRVSK